MDPIRTIRYRFRALTRKARLDREAEDEMRFHIEMLAADHEANGLPKHEALRRAKIEFGGIERMKEKLRDARGTLWIETFMKDINHSLRQLRKSPGYALAAISIVALGVALATTTASIVDALVFRTLPIAQYAQLYRVKSGIFNGVATAPDARDIFERTDIPAFSYHHRTSVEYVQGKNSGLIGMCELQGDAFKVLGWQAEQGRLLQPSDFLEGSEPVAVLSHAFWENELAAPDDIIDQNILLNGKPFRVVGILPTASNRVHRTTRPQVWTALVHTFDDWIYNNRNSFGQTIIARLPSASALPAYQTQLDQLTDHFQQTSPNTSANLDLQALPESQAARADSANAVQQSYIITSLVIALLLTACFNVGNMLLANAYRRDREFAIRRSVGASSIQIGRQLLLESSTIAIAGGIVGLILSFWLIRLADQLPFTKFVDVQLDSRALLVSLAATLATGLLSGLIPTWHLARGNAADTLKRGSRGSSVALATKCLVLAQVALSAALLTSTFLYSRSLQKSFAFDPGYDAERLASFRVSLQSVPLDRREQVAKDLREQIAALPGVEFASLTTIRLLQRYGWTHIKTDKYDPNQEADKCFSNYSFSSPGLPETLGLPLLEGRDFLESESTWPFKVALVNEAFQRRFFPDGSAHNQEFWPWGDAGEDRIRIIGIIKDFSIEPWSEPAPLLLLPQTQARSNLYVRAESDPRSLLSTLETITRDPSNEYVAQEVNFYSDAQKQTFSNERSSLYVLATLALSALLLSSAGVWYTTRQFVRQNRKEMSIRMALGANQGGLLVLTLRRSLTLVAIGLGLGSLLSFVAAHWIQSALQGAAATDPLPYTAMLVTLFVVAFIASYLPAKSALKAHPREALSEM